ncbi:thioredoxin [Candidatus Microgenomates bacterium]|jgi:thiol-disulfide isomerase/thioredoxin|nr:MAG: thioredoxin [Candidatus Microgenomates bacterium]
MNKNIKTLAVLFLVAASASAGFLWTKNNLSGDGEVRGEKIEPSPTVKPAPNYPKTVGNFLITDKEVIFENEKPVIYFFGSASCPHCTWEKPIVQKVAEKFEGEIVYKENYDETPDEDVFAKYSDINPGYIPFLVLGGKYVRVGAGEQLGATEEGSKKLEEEALTAIICKLTESKPEGICTPLEEKISEIK